MEIKTLEKPDLNEILNVFNESFSDYFIPFQLTKEQLELKILADKTDLRLSVGAFENEHLISFILHGFDIIDNQRVAYNAGTGVVPEKRGFGLTKKMYQFVLPLLIEKHIDKIILEVINNNIQAIKSYEKSGFKTNRHLFCYHGKAQISSINKHLIMKRLQKYDWSLMSSFWDILPTWQNSKNVLDSFKSANVSLGGYIKNQLVGYVIYNPEKKRIQQIAVDRKFREKKIASTLISELIKHHGNALSIINVDNSSESTVKFISRIGLERNLEQLEMELKLVQQFKA